MESLSSTVKAEVGEHFDSCGAAKMEVFDYIELFHNPHRRHSTLDYVSPAGFERRSQGVNADAPVDAKNAPTRGLENRTERGLPQRPHPSSLCSEEERPTIGTAE
jgi:putative transposase